MRKFTVILFLLVFLSPLNQHLVKHLQSFGFLKQRLMHIFLYASMTRAMTTEEIRRLGGEPSWGVAPANPFGSSVRKICGVGGHRILMRNKFHFNSTMEASDRDIQRTVRNHDRSFQRRFPMLKNLEMEYRWGGRLCLSWNGVPVFGEIEDEHRYDLNYFCN